MRTPVLMLAIALAACSQQPDNAMNVEANGEAGGAGDVPILGNEGQAPAAPIGNGEAPAPPGQNEPSPAPEPGGEVTLAAAPAQTRAGGSMTLTLSNGSREKVGYNLCTSALQTAAGVAVKTDRICTLELRTLDPGRTADYRYDLPGSLPDGRYRFSTGLERMPNGGRISVTSNSFEVR